MTYRDEMCVQLMAMRQYVRDIPDHQVPEVAQMIAQLEDHMRKLCGIQRHQKSA